MRAAGAGASEHGLRFGLCVAQFLKVKWLINTGYHEFLLLWW